MRSTTTSLGVLCAVALALAACAPVGGPAPRVDLRRVAAEVAATAAAQPSPLAESTVPAAPTPGATIAPTPMPSPTLVPPTPVVAATSAPTATLAPTAAPSPPTAATPAATPAAPPTPTLLSGRLEPGGTFAQYGFDYPGDRSVFTVNLHVEPDDAGLLKNAGFIVYGPNAEEIVRGGAQPGRRPNVSADVIHTRPGRYLVQVQNYDPARPISYQIDLVTGPPPG